MRMKTLVSAMIGTLVLMTVAYLASASEEFTLNGDADNGKSIYGKYCMTCHGQAGGGDGPVGKMMNPKPRSFSDKASMASLTDEQVYKVISGGGTSVGKSPLMTAWKGTLTDQQIRDVAAYVRSLGK